MVLYNLGLLGFVIVGFAITYCFCFRFVGVVAMVVRCGLHVVVVWIQWVLQLLMMVWL